MRTFDVQDPELDGWKKLSVLTINLTKQSNAFEPAINVVCSGLVPGWKGDSAGSGTNGVAIPEGGEIGLSSCIEYTIMVASDPMTRVSGAHFS